jgi:hypothetical protein
MVRQVDVVLDSVPVLVLVLVLDMPVTGEVADCVEEGGSDGPKEVRAGQRWDVMGVERVGREAVAEGGEDRYTLD